MASDFTLALTTAQADLKDAERQRDEARAALAAIQTARDEAVEARDQAVSHNNDLQAMFDASHAREIALEQRLGATATDLGQARLRASDLTTKLEGLLEQSTDLQQVGDARQQELARVRTDLEEAQQRVATLTGARGIYTVQPADSLSTIATFFYRQGLFWPEILAANHHLIDDPDLIFPGMVLIIPQLDSD